VVNKFKTFSDVTLELKCELPMGGGILIGDSRPPGGVTNTSAGGIVKEATISKVGVFPLFHSVSSGPAPQTWERGVETYGSELDSKVASVLLNEWDFKLTVFGWKIAASFI